MYLYIILWLILLFIVYLLKWGLWIGSLAKNITLRFSLEIRKKWPDIWCENNSKLIQGLMIEILNNVFQENFPKIEISEVTLYSIVETSLKEEKLEEFLLRVITDSLIIFFSLKKNIPIEDVRRDFNSDRVKNIIHSEIYNWFIKPYPGLAKLTLN